MTWLDSYGMRNVYISSCILDQGSFFEAAGYGVFWGFNNQNNVSGSCPKGATKLTAEILAVTEAIKVTDRTNMLRVRVNTDSNDLIEATAKDGNLEKWKRNGWRSLYNGQPIKNRAEWESLDIAMRNTRAQILFEMISDPSGSAFYKEADRLAKLGAKQAKQQN